MYNNFYRYTNKGLYENKSCPKKMCSIVSGYAEKTCMVDRTF